VKIRAARSEARYLGMLDLFETFASDERYRAKTAVWKVEKKLDGFAGFAVQLLNLALLTTTIP
jgi:hypothetical protein